MSVSIHNLIKKINVDLHNEIANNFYSSSERITKNKEEVYSCCQLFELIISQCTTSHHNLAQLEKKPT